MCISETLPVEHLGGKPLCMNQYYEVLSSCRIPGLKRDSVVNHAKSSKPPKHITVVHNFQVRSTPVFSLFLEQTPVIPNQFNCACLRLTLSKQISLECLLLVGHYKLPSWLDTSEFFFILPNCSKL